MGSLNSCRTGRRPCTGFTLVEMLVVLVILGIAAAVFVPRLAPDGRRILEREAIRMAGALEHASAAAQWRGETLGISAEGASYRFWRRDGLGEWQVMTSDEVLAPHALPDGVRIRPERYAGAMVAANAILPLRPSGRNDPYGLTILASGWAASIDSDPLNRVTWRIVATAAPGS